MEGKNLKFFNVMQSVTELYDYCIKNGWYEGTEDDFYENGEEYIFFEGDPDMIKIAGELGMFCRCGDIVFYLIDNHESQAEGILRDFFGSFEATGFFKDCHSKECPADCQNWDAWERLETAIAYRGGSGYVYNIIPLRTDKKLRRFAH